MCFVRLSVKMIVFYMCMYSPVESKADNVIHIVIYIEFFFVKKMKIYDLNLWSSMSLLVAHANAAAFKWWQHMCERAGLLMPCNGPVSSAHHPDSRPAGRIWPAKSFNVACMLDVGRGSPVEPGTFAPAAQLYSSSSAIMLQTHLQTLVILGLVVSNLLADSAPPDCLASTHVCRSLLCRSERTFHSQVCEDGGCQIKDSMICNMTIKTVLDQFPSLRACLCVEEQEEELCGSVHDLATQCLPQPAAQVKRSTKAGWGESDLKDNAYGSSGTCSDQVRACVSDSVCNRHLAPVLLACAADHCVPDQCRGATQDFYAQMPIGVAEMLAMCDCNSSDQSCMLMKLMLHSGACGQETELCLETVNQCVTDSECRQVINNQFGLPRIHLNQMFPFTLNVQETDEDGMRVQGWRSYDVIVAYSKMGTLRSTTPHSPLNHCLQHQNTHRGFSGRNSYYTPVDTHLFHAKVPLRDLFVNFQSKCWHEEDRHCTDGELGQDCFTHLDQGLILGSDSACIEAYIATLGTPLHHPCSCEQLQGQDLLSCSMILHIFHDKSHFINPLTESISSAPPAADEPEEQTYYVLYTCAAVFPVILCLLILAVMTKLCMRRQKKRFHPPQKSNCVLIL
ncbi:uncharacterized protein gfral [Synchiropus picturatus]